MDSQFYIIDSLPLDVLLEWNANLVIGHSNIDKTKVLNTDNYLMQVKSIAECSPLEHSAISLPALNNYHYGSFLSGCLR